MGERIARPVIQIYGERASLSIRIFCAIGTSRFESQARSQKQENFKGRHGLAETLHMGRETSERLIEDCERLVRAGDFAEARALLSGRSKSEIDRGHTAPAANLARRLGLYRFGLGLLRPFVRPETGVRIAPATPEERAVYAALLIKVGSASEALGILSDLGELPDRLLYSAFAHQSTWEYATAASFLERYVEHPGITPYQRATGLVNLAAAFAFLERTDDAKPVLARLIESSRRENWQLLLASSLEIAGRIAMSGGHWAESARLIEEAGSLLKGSSNVSLFAKKSRAILEIVKSPKSASARERVVRLRAEAVRESHWETVRECDFHLSRAREDRDLFLRVYFGTPFSSYRELMRRKGAFAGTIPEHFVLRGAKAPKRVLDLEAASEIGGGSSLKGGQKLHLLLGALAKDAYKPTLVGALAAELFPGEYFDAERTPKRISDLVARLRGWLREEEWPFEIEASEGAYRLQIAGAAGLSVALPETRAPKSSSSLRIQALTEHFGENPFSASEAAQKLGLSVRSLNDLLKSAVASGDLTQEGRARATRYRVPTKRAA